MTTHAGEQIATIETPSGAIELCYEQFGDPSHETILLVMGFTAQMIVWPEGLIDDLVGRGFHVVRFDNRDCGLSAKTAGTPPNVVDIMGRAATGEDLSGSTPYALVDMAADAVGLLDHLEIDAAHVVGASMGGMIVQELAIHHADRLRSVTSIMSTTGNREVGQADPEAIGALLAPPPADRDAVIAQSVTAGKIFAGPLFEPELAADRAARSFDRSFHPVGAAFQIAAISASGDRTEQLQDVAVPFLVIHGQQDALIHVSGGHATHEAVPGADLLVLDAMGHDLPEPLWGQINGAIDGIARRSVLQS